MIELERTLPNLVEAFVEYLEPCEVPISFKRWAGIALVAGAMERRFWCWGRGYKIHPNVFIILIAKPGVGKSVVVDTVTELWSATGEFNLIANKSTLAAFLEAAVNPQLITGERGAKILTNPSVLGLGEFGHLFVDKDNTMMNVINSFYDAKETPFVDKTISRGTVTIDCPILTMVAGTQPQYLDSVLPERSFQMGFATRLIMCYSDAVASGLVFDKSKQRPQPELFKCIVEDLKKVKTHGGEFHFDVEAQQAFEAWNQAGCPPVPTHMRLQDYNTRRWASAFKLCQILTCAKSNSLVVTKREVDEAIRLLLTAEEDLPLAFAAMTGESDSAQLGEVFNYVFKEYMRTKKPVNEQRIVAVLMNRVPAHRIPPMIETLIYSGAIKPEGNFPPKLRMFVPGDNTEAFRRG